MCTRLVQVLSITAFPPFWLKPPRMCDPGLGVDDGILGNPGLGVDDGILVHNLVPLFLLFAVWASAVLSLPRSICRVWV